MKRSIQVAAPLLASTAMALLAGCHQPEMQRCVDEQNHVVADSLCQTPGVAGQQHPTGSGVGFFPVPIYRYYYGGGGGWGLGSTATGGGYVATPGRSYATSTSRGGFGSSFGGRGGGGGE
jgi:hypothetical protein